MVAVLSPTSDFPRYRPVADHAVLVEFGDTIDDGIHGQVIQLDAALSANPFAGFIEAVPAYANILVCFDPMITDHIAVEGAVSALIANASAARRADTQREVEICYDEELAPDLNQIAKATGLAPDQVIDIHLTGKYKVYLYGFAPGYAYMAGIPKKIQLPRKQTAVRGVPDGSVLIAGPQCLVSTLTMPTGWWIIGRSPTRILREDTERPFLFDVGDTVTFRRISRADFDKAGRD